MKQGARFGLRLCLLAVAFVCVMAMLLPARRIASKIQRAFETAPLFANGTGGYYCYRIPAIVQTPDGTLLAFAEARKNDCDDFGDIQIVMRSSHDDGQSWSGLQTVASNGKLQTGNPVPVVDTMDPRYLHGRVFLVYTSADTAEDELAKGHGSAHVWYRASADDGTTWASPVEITASVKARSWGNYGTAPGHGLQLTDGPHKGRIFIPGFHTERQPGSDQIGGAAHGFFSDDHGQTWTLGPTVAWQGTSESTAAQASDGSLVMSSRDETGTSHARILSISHDGGERWDKSSIARDLPDPGCEGSMVSYTPPGHKPVLLFSNVLNTDTDHRHGLAISESADGGRSWPRHTVIDKGSSQYSDLVVMRGGKLGILWERWADGIHFGVRPIGKLF
ncbi:MAG: sialidase [Acidobacteriaceae bacterium]|nr:sialidase [Acidobacteriaceae bacterium]